MSDNVTGFPPYVPDPSTCPMGSGLARYVAPALYLTAVKLLKHSLQVR
jgi:hypothetical protein